MKSKKVFLLGTTIVLVLGLFFLIGNIGSRTFAASLSRISDTMSRIQVSVASNHTIEFVTPTGVNAAGETVIVAFNEEAPSFGLSSVAHGDMDLVFDSGGTCGGSFTDKTLGGTAGAGTWGVSVNNTTGLITFTAPTDATTGEIPAGSCVRILIGDHATSGTNQITNPSSDGQYRIGISGTFGDVGALAVSILTDDQIEITAEIEPTLDVLLSSNACDLGALNSTFIKTCNYDVTVSTNGTSGYISTIVADGDLRNSVDSIANASAGTVVKGSEEYGVGTSKSGQTILQNTDCTDEDTGASQPASALTASAQQFASSSGPVSSDATTVCHLASVSGATPAGFYSQIVTIVVTANF
jgi:hypothetical protein